MSAIYIMWVVLPALFLVGTLVMRAREGRAGRRDESGVDPMFRRDRPVGRREPRSTAGRGR
ncbi:MAG: hypothetical protein ABSC19_03075 [Syntrophorhabdales bacterium]|jgi:hypothetical protein